MYFILNFFFGHLNAVYAIRNLRFVFNCALLMDFMFPNVCLILLLMMTKSIIVLWPNSPASYVTLYFFSFLYDVLHISNSFSIHKSIILSLLLFIFPSCHIAFLTYVAVPVYDTKCFYFVFALLYAAIVRKMMHSGWEFIPESFLRCQTIKHILEYLF